LYSKRNNDVKGRVISPTAGLACKVYKEEAYRLSNYAGISSRKRLRSASEGSMHTSFFPKS
jgi:hypothetical protein